MGFGSWLKKRLKPPKSIRKFQLKKLGSGKWWKDFAGEVALPAAAIATGAGALGMGPLAGVMGSLGGAAGGAAKSVGGLGSKLGGLGGAAKFLGIGDGQDGFTLNDITSTIQGPLGKLAGAGIGGKMMWDASKQSKKDSRMARQLSQEAIDMYRKSAQEAQERYNLNSPLRDAFRQGALNFADPTNPFSRGSMFAGFQPQFEGAGPQAAAPMMPPPMMTGGPRPPMGVGNSPFAAMLGGGGPFLPPGPQIPPMIQTGVPGSANVPMLRMMGSQLGGAKGGPAGRTRSVKGGNVNQAQDRGRDEMEMN